MTKMYVLEVPTDKVEYIGVSSLNAVSGIYSTVSGYAMLEI